MKQKNPTTMSELCQYSKLKRLELARRHRRDSAQYGECSGLTNSEYNRVKYPQKSTFSGSRKFTHNRMWKHQSRYSVKQLINIIKT